MKHNFYKLKKTSDALPIDINATVEAALDKLFQCKELNDKLTEIREKRKFREIVYAKGKIACELSAVHGIIPQYFLISTIETSNGGRLVIKDSVKNENLTYPKDNE